jgi:uncharacterized RDD family membrane protein YckC
MERQPPVPVHTFLSPPPHAPPYPTHAGGYYPVSAGYYVPGQIVAGQRVSSVGKLIIAAILDSLLVLITLWIGWLIWAIFAAGRAQTPAKQLLGMRVVDLATGRPLTWGYYVFMRGLIGGIVGSLASTFTFGVLWFMPVWDTHNQSVAAKVSNSVVINT